MDHRDHDINLPSLAHMNLPKCDRDKIAGISKLCYFFRRIIILLILYVKRKVNLSYE